MRPRSQTQGTRGTEGNSLAGTWQSGDRGDDHTVAFGVEGRVGPPAPVLPSVDV